MEDYYEPGLLSGLGNLQSLKEFVLDDRTNHEEFLKEVQEQLARNRNGPVLIREDWRKL